MVKTAIGQDSHAFVSEADTKQLRLGGIIIPGCKGLAGNSDADVILHALTNAISGISGVTILGKVSDDLCLNQGITDSTVYLQKALETLNGYRITHCSISVECQVPKLAPHTENIRRSVAQLLSIEIHDVGLTATTGEKLSTFGKGAGIQVFVIVTAQKITPS